LTTSIPTPRPDTSLTVSAVEKIHPCHRLLDSGDPVRRPVGDSLRQHGLRDHHLADLVEETIDLVHGDPDDRRLVAIVAAPARPFGRTGRPCLAHGHRRDAQPARFRREAEARFQLFPGARRQERQAPRQVAGVRFQLEDRGKRVQIRHDLAQSVSILDRHAPRPGSRPHAIAYSFRLQWTGLTGT
jgi:hypothetical protein